MMMNRKYDHISGGTQMKKKPFRAAVQWRIADMTCAFAWAPYSALGSSCVEEMVDNISDDDELQRGGLNAESKRK